MTTPHEIEQWLQQGIIAAKAGQLEQARFQLLDVVEQDHTNETAWYWLFQVFDRVDDKRICLENLIIINPQNMWAKQELLKILEAATLSQPMEQSATQIPLVSPAASPVSTRAKKSQKEAPPQNESRPVVLKLVTAFWFGISIFLLGGGIISALEWLFASPDGLATSTTFSMLNLTMGVIFVITGVMGLNVAFALYFRAMAGFYGSVLLAMGLLLVGPMFSLITDPPNYTAMLCTGGIPGMIVLLTLASQPGFKDTSSAST